jgi:hypothetical protein
MSTVPRLFIDTLELTIPVEEHRQQLVQERLEYAGERWRANLIELQARGRYRFRYELSTPSDHTITIQSQPASRRGNYLKLAYSPEKIGPEGAEFLAEYLSAILGPTCREEFYQGYVSRIDVTFDIHRVSLDNFWIDDLRAGMKCALIRGKSSRIETIYLGYGASRQLYAYDKAQQMREVGGLTRISVPWVRFEYRCRKADYPLIDLYRRMKNPYNNFLVRRYAPLRHLMPDYQSRALFDACMLRGKMGVLNSVAEEDRGAVETAIKAFPYATIWTRRSAIWVQLRDRIDELLPVVVNAAST